MFFLCFIALLSISLKYGSRSSASPVRRGDSSAFGPSVNRIGEPLGQYNSALYTGESAIERFRLQTVARQPLSWAESQSTDLDFIHGSQSVNAQDFDWGAGQLFHPPEMRWQASWGSSAHQSTGRAGNQVDLPGQDLSSYPFDRQRILHQREVGMLETSEIFPFQHSEQQPELQYPPSPGAGPSEQVEQYVPPSSERARSRARRGPAPKAPLNKAEPSARDLLLERKRVAERERRAQLNALAEELDVPSTALTSITEYDDFMDTPGTTKADYIDFVLKRWELNKAKRRKGGQREIATLLTCSNEGN